MTFESTSLHPNRGVPPAERTNQRQALVRRPAFSISSRSPQGPENLPTRENDVAFDSPNDVLQASCSGSSNRSTITPSFSTQCLLTELLDFQRTRRAIRDVATDLPHQRSCWGESRVHSRRNRCVHHWHCSFVPRHHALP